MFLPKLDSISFSDGIEISKYFFIPLTELDFLKVEKLSGSIRSIFNKTNQSGSYIFFPFEYETFRKIQSKKSDEKKLEFLRFKVPELFTEGNQKIFGINFVNFFCLNFRK